MSISDIVEDNPIPDKIFKKGRTYEGKFDLLEDKNLLISNKIDDENLKISYIILNAKKKGLQSGIYKVKTTNICKSNSKNYYTINSKVIDKIN